MTSNTTQPASASEQTSAERRCPPLGCPADVDRAIAAGLLPDNDVTRQLRAYLAKPFRHGEMTADDFEAMAVHAAERGISVSHINLSGQGDVVLTLGAGGEIMPPVPSVISHSRN